MGEHESGGLPTRAPSAETSFAEANVTPTRRWWTHRGAIVGIVVVVCALVAGAGVLFNVSRQDSTPQAQGSEPRMIGDDLVSEVPASTSPGERERQEWDSGLRYARDAMHQAGAMLINHEPGGVFQPDRFEKLPGGDVARFVRFAVADKGWTVEQVGCVPRAECPQVARVTGPAGNQGALNVAIGPEWDAMEPVGRLEVALQLTALPADLAPVIRVRNMRADLWLFNTPTGWGATLWPTGPTAPDGDTGDN